MRRGLKWAFTCFLVVLVAAPSWAAPAARVREGRPGATADERQLGQLAADQLIQQFGLVQEEALQARLDGVARTLTKYVPSGDSYRFRILKSDDVNAMTTPDGQVFVTRFLMRVFRNDDDLAAVLAHEISHVLLGHTARLLTEPDEERTVIVRGRGRRPVRRTITVTSETKKHWEFEADEAGLDLLEKAGYPLTGMERVLEYLATEELEKARRGTESSMDQLTSTHPRSVDRLRSLRQLLAKRAAITARDPGPPALSLERPTNTGTVPERPTAR